MMMLKRARGIFCRYFTKSFGWIEEGADKAFVARAAGGIVMVLYFKKDLRGHHIFSQLF